MASPKDDLLYNITINSVTSERRNTTHSAGKHWNYFKNAFTYHFVKVYKSVK